MLRTQSVRFLLLTLVVLLASSEIFAQKRIRFARGRTSATVSGSIKSGGKRTFVIRARQGQTLTAVVSSSNGEVTFDTDEVNLSITTVAGDNVITIMNPTVVGATRYSLEVSIR